MNRQTRKQNLRYLLLSLFLILMLFFLAIPIMTKLALFLGNLKSGQTKITSEDKIAPITPVLFPTYESTNSANLLISGQTESGVKVKLFQNQNQIAEEVSDNEGKFSHQINLSLGKNEIWVIAVDNAGNQSQSPNQTIIYDNQPPEIIIDSPTDNSIYYGYQQKVEIKGKVESQASLAINERQIILNSIGEFTYLYNLKEGDNLIKLVAIDQAGNQTTKELKLRKE